MFKKKILKSFKKGTFLATVSTIAILSFSSVESHANTYYIRTLFDDGNFGIISQVISDKSEGKDYLERDKGVDFSAIADYRKVGSGGLIADITKPATEAKDTYKELLNNSDKNMGLVFSFPGIVDTSVTYTAKSSDLERAELVSNTLTKGLNDALMFIKTHTGREHIAGEGLRHVASKLAQKTSQFSEGGSSTFNTGSTAGSKGFSIVQVSGPSQNGPGGKKVRDELVPVNGLRYSDYVYLSTTNTEGKVVYSYFPWRMQKGYHYNSILGNIVGDEYMTQAKDKENIYLTWGQLIIQAGVNADFRAQEIVDSSSDVMTLIGQGLGSDLTSTITSVRSMLNLAPIQELILNMGARSTTHHYGVMTEEMYDTAKTVYVLVLIVSLLFLSALIVKMIHQKMISTTNIVAKTSLMEGLQDIIFVGVMLAFFPSIFEIMLELNYWIVKTFSFSNDYLLAYGVNASKVLSTESLAGFIVSSMFLSIDVYINTTYLVRAIVVSFLFAISPLLTVSYCWGPMQKKLYFGYMRELVGNVFMQSFHAITMTFFAGYNSTNMSSMEAIASAYCFIPITQLFRQLVIGSQGGFSENIGGKLAGQLTNTATGLHKSGVAMRQSKELFDMQAKNAKNTAIAGFGAQITGVAGDLIGSTVQSSMMGKEIGNLGTGAKQKGATTSSGGKFSGSVGANLKSAAVGAGIGMVGAGIGAIGSGLVGKNSRDNLGEMQMNHSMENIGIGLAQVGMGLGTSSFDAASGNSMMGAGLLGTQQGAAKYGEGQSNAGYGGSMYGVATGLDTVSKTAPRTILRTGQTAIRHHETITQENQKAQNLEKLQQEKVDSRGIDNKEVLTGMGVTNSDKLNANINIKPSEGNKNNVVFNVSSKNSKAVDYSKVQGNSDVFNYIKQLQSGTATPEQLEKAFGKAVKAGLEPSYGGNGTGIAGDIKSGNISFIVNNASRYGFEFDNVGQGYAVSDNTHLKTSSDENK